MAIVKFEANIPQTLAFTYDTGKETEGQYGQQFFRKTMSGDSVYLPPIVEDKLGEMGYKAQRPVTISKTVQGKTTRWEVYWPEESPERPLAGQPHRSAPTAARAPVTGSRAGTMATVMQNVLREAVDLAIFTTDYAKSKGYPLQFNAAEIEALAVTLYIQHSKAGNIRAMHDYEEYRMRAPQNGSDAEFRQAGSQAAADAVAKRKVAELQLPPPPPQDFGGITDDDVPF